MLAMDAISVEEGRGEQMMQYTAKQRQKHRLTEENVPVRLKLEQCPWLLKMIKV